MQMASRVPWSRIIWERSKVSLGLGSRSVDAPDLALQTWIHELEGAPPVKGHIAVLAMRTNTWFDFAAYTACWLRRLGYRTTLLYSSADRERCYGRGATLRARIFANQFTARLTAIPDISLVDIDALPLPTQEGCLAYHAWAEDMAPTVAAYDLRVEEYDGYPVEAKYRKHTESCCELLAKVASQAHALFTGAADERPSRLVAYSGLIGVTPAIGEAARRAGMDVVFCEAWTVKVGHMICSMNQPAMIYDIPAWLKLLSPVWDDDYQREVENFLRFQESNDGGDSEWLKKYHQFQRTSFTDELPSELISFLENGERIFLLAPNCVGDSATLRVQAGFKNQREWLQAICNWFKSHPTFRLVIRAHPDELMLEKAGKLVLRMGEVAVQVALGVPNVYVIQGRESISTYGLIQVSHVGLVWMSTIGVDIVVRGRPVLAAARPKYSGLGIVEEPKTREDYFAILERLAREPEAPTQEQREMGKKYLAILSREFSYESFSATYRATGIHLSGHAPRGEFETFYRMLAGELPIPSRPHSRAEGRI